MAFSWVSGWGAELGVRAMTMRDTKGRPEQQSSPQNKPVVPVNFALQAPLAGRYCWVPRTAGSHSSAMGYTCPWWAIHRQPLGTGSLSSINCPDL